jgi:teichuronic acid biosynthesis glycosyltransferase TuaC
MNTQASMPEPATTGRIAAPRGRRFKVLVLSRNYPNSVLPLLGLWAEGIVRSCAKFCEMKVVSPVPYCPPLPGLPEAYARFRRIEPRRQDGFAEVFHPRFLVPPGHRFHSLESFMYYWSVVGLADRIRREFPFDLIHAHFVFPDGYVAAKLGQRYRVPVIITEQAAWHPWMENYPLVRRKALWAFEHCAFLVAISQAHRKTIAQYTGESSKLRLIPDSVDGSVFTLPENGFRPANNQVLFVGVIRHVKGVDILVRAMRLLADRGRDLKLVLVGESFYEGYRRDYEQVRQLVREMGLESHMAFAGMQPIGELVRTIQQSALLVLPSRRESLGMVLAEALACGTPVVATRCGGPEDIVNDRVGVLVPPEDPAALAEGIAQVLDRRASYDPARLRAYALENFGMEAVGSRIEALYCEALGEGRTTSQ